MNFFHKGELNCTSSKCYKRPFSLSVFIILNTKRLSDNVSSVDSSKRSYLQSSGKSGLLAPLLGSFIGLVFLGAAVWFGLRYFRNR